jgi:hypothetical protein
MDVSDKRSGRLYRWEESALSIGWEFECTPELLKDTVYLI